MGERSDGRRHLIAVSPPMDMVSAAATMLDSALVGGRIEGLVAHPLFLSTPVSYTHLDVYKRQA